jgi:hypothetical protein
MSPYQHYKMLSRASKRRALTWLSAIIVLWVGLALSRVFWQRHFPCKDWVSLVSVSPGPAPTRRPVHLCASIDKASQAINIKLGRCENSAVQSVFESQVEILCWPRPIVHTFVVPIFYEFEGRFLIQGRRLEEDRLGPAIAMFLNRNSWSEYRMSSREFFAKAVESGKRDRSLVAGGVLSLAVTIFCTLWAVRSIYTNINLFRSHKHSWELLCCSKCQYDMSRSRAHFCPECGFPYALKDCT